MQISTIYSMLSKFRAQVFEHHIISVYLIHDNHRKNELNLA